MKILSIETSCDDTGVTIFEAKGEMRNASFNILANITSSQTIHVQFGGVFPMMAKREHIKNLPIATELVLKKTKLEKRNRPVDAVAVTYGPGLEPCLWSGIVFAKELAKKWAVPLVSVNHMEGHILSVFAKPKGKFKINLPTSKFPMLSLLVSGGHTELVLVKDIGKYEIIGKTLDDAAGEAYDKVARMLDLPYPGGPKISKLAEEERERLRGYVGYGSLGRRDGAGQRNLPTGKFCADRTNMSSQPFKFPRPMLNSPNLDFSFSGLKTSVLYTIRKIKKLDEDTKRAIALEFENAVVETLIYKMKKAVQKHKVTSIIVAGGVAANKHLQRELRKTFGKGNILLPDKTLTGDNAIMIGVAGYLEYMKNKKKVPKVGKIIADGNLLL